MEVAAFALDKKAENCSLLVLGKLSSVADYIFICSGESERQVQAIANNIEDGLRKKKVRPLSIEGYDAGRWVLMDYNDVIVHIFLEQVRTRYDLEGLWSDADKVDLADLISSSKRRKSEKTPQRAG